MSEEYIKERLEDLGNLLIAFNSSGALDRSAYYIIAHYLKSAFGCENMLKLENEDD